MGLTNWKDTPDGKIMLSDVKVAKNYLSDEEISELNRIVNMYLDYAENLALRHKLMSMKDWASLWINFWNSMNIKYCMEKEVFLEKPLMNL